VKLRIVAVGPVKERHLRESIDVYIGRLERYCRVEEVEVRDGPKVAAALERACRDAIVVALEVEGEAITSKQMARRVERLASQGKGIVALVIGGADGLPPAFSRAARERWSLSRLTFPHRIARLVLSEQLYRSMTILRGEPYDH